MRKHCIWVIGFVLLSYGGMGQSKVENTLRLAQERLDSMQYHEAWQLAQSIIQRKHAAAYQAQAYLILGDIAMEQLDFPSAKAKYTRGLAQLQHLPPGAQAPLRAQFWNALGEYELKQDQLDQAIHWHEAALRLRKQIFGEKHEKTADSYNNLGNCYLKVGDYQQASTFHEQALSIRKSVLPAQHPDLAVSYTNLGNCAYYKGEFEAAVQFYRAALQIRERVFGPRHNKITPTLNNLGKVRFELGQWDQALQLFQRVLQIRQETYGAQHSSLAPTFENIGEVLLEKGDFPAAIPYLQQAVYLFGGSENPASTTAWHKIGLCYQRSGNYDKALQYHLAAIRLIQAIDDDPISLSSIYSNIAVCYLQKAEYDLSSQDFLKALTILNQAFPQGHPDQVQIYYSLAICYLRQGFLREAADYNQSALRVLRTLGQDRGILSAQVWRIQAEILFHAGRLKDSQNALQKALQLLNYRHGQALWGNEVTDEVMKILTQQAQNWKAIALSERNQDHSIRALEKAAAINLEALRLMVFLRRQLSTSTARRFWLQRQYKLYREAIDLHFRLWQKSGRATDLEQAFLLSEQSKGTQLSEAIQSASETTASSIPAAWQKKEQQLLSQLAELEQQKIAIPARTAEYERKMLDLMRQLDGWQKKISRWRQQEGLAPKGQDTVYPVALLQRRLLSPRRALVEYFETESSLLVFVLSQSALKGFALPKSADLVDQIVEFRQLLRLYPALNGTALDSNLQAWCQRSHQLYRALMQPLQTSLRGMDELVIVPDGPLSYLPFEALLCKLPRDASRFKSHAYLLRQVAVQYSYSGSLALELSQRSRVHWVKPPLLSLAPDFRQHSLGLGELYHNQKEAQEIGRIWRGGIVLTGTAANLPHFLELAPKYRVLHLATHGSYYASTENTEGYAALAFADSGDESRPTQLDTRALYALRLPTEMVVLSACETGMGDYHSGEGVTSLAHGFIHAGANSVVNTLWSVDDARTAELVVDFFRELKKGQTRHQALQQAKLHLLERYPHDEVHPYYWAALVGIGDTSPLYNPWASVGLILASIQGIGLLIWVVWRLFSRRHQI